MKKHWHDNPRSLPGSENCGAECSEPETRAEARASACTRACACRLRCWWRRGAPCNSAGPHGRRYRHGFPPLHPQRQPVHACRQRRRHGRHRISNQQSGCGLIMTEFTSADGLSRMRETKRKRYLTFYDDEHPIAAQLFGSNPRRSPKPRSIVEDAGFDIVDLNLGCPAKRVVALQRRLRPAARSAADRQHLRGHARLLSRFPSPSNSAWDGMTTTLSASSWRVWRKRAD